MSLTESRSSFGSDSLALIGGQIAISIFSLGSVVITARTLDTGGRGQFSLALLFAYTLFMFTEFGLGSAGIRFMAAGHWPRPVILASHGFAIAVRILVTGLVGLAILLLAGEKVFPGVPVEYLFLGLLHIVPLMVAGSILPLLLGLGLAKTYNRILVLNSLFALGLLCIGWVLTGLTVRTALLLQFGAGIIISVIIWRITSQAAGGLARPNFSYLLEAYRFGMGMYASGVLSFANTRLIWIFINSFVGVSGVGLYTIAQTATDRIYLIADAFGTILYPRVAENPERNSARLTPVVFRVILLTGIGLSIGMALVADWLVRFLFSDSFAGAVPILRLLLVGVVISSGWKVLSQDLNGRGYSGVTAFVNGAAMVVGLGLALLLLPRIGLEGAAWSSIAAAGISLLAGVWLYGRFRGEKMEPSSLFILSDRERQFAGRMLRGSANAVQFVPRYTWGLAVEHIPDRLALRFATLLKSQSIAQNHLSPGKGSSVFNKLSRSTLDRGFYWWLQGIRRRCIGTRVDEKIWKRRSHSHVRKGLVNVTLPHRVWLVDRILCHFGITSQNNDGQVHASILEIGCGCGANLEVLARHAPSIRLIGVDISPASIEVGRERFAELGMRGVTLLEGRADNLGGFANGSVDVVFTDAVLLYIGPDKIKTCIEEMRRIARRAIILLEMHLDGMGLDGVYTRDGWVRDYRVLCEQLGYETKLLPMPPETRPAGRWPKYGTLIEVKLPGQFYG